MVQRLLWYVVLSQWEQQLREVEKVLVVHSAGRGLY